MKKKLSFLVISSPLQVRSTSPSSTSLNVEWDPLPSGSETAETSILSGYIIFYKESTAESYNKIAVQPSLQAKRLENLQKFTQYKIVVCPYSGNGNGIPSLPLENTTLEDGKDYDWNYDQILHTTNLNTLLSCCGCV